MKRMGRKFIWIGLVACIGALLAWWFGAGGLSSEARRDFEWFSTLGFPDVKGCRYVRIATGWPAAYLDETHSNYYITAFLLDTNATNFTVLEPDLNTRTFTNTPDGTSEAKRVGYTVVDLRDDAQKKLDILRHPPKEDRSRMVFNPSPIAQHAEIFVLAWACWRQGLNSEANQLYEEAKTFPERRIPRRRRLAGWKAVRSYATLVYETVKEKLSRQASTRPKATFRQTLTEDFANFAMYRAAVSFWDESLTRPELLAKVEAVLDHYRSSRQETNAAELAGRLQKSIAEGQTHPRIDTNDLVNLPVEDRVRELIFQLRDHDDHWSFLSKPFDVSPVESNAPAFRLVKIGYAAVPQLIAALDSTTPTRYVPNYSGFGGVGYNYYYPQMIVTVGDLAGIILQSITGRDFDMAGSTAMGQSPNTEASPTKQAAEAWLAEFQKKGAKQMLIEGVSSGLQDAPDQAELLIERYPEAATEALRRGIHASNEESTRSSLIQLMAKLSDETSIGTLNDELRNAPSVASRVAAAEGLRSHGHKAEALAAMIQEWENPAPRNVNNPTEIDGVIQFLAGCDSVEAIAALEKDFRNRPVELRLTIIQSLGDRNDWPVEHETKAPSTETLAATEKSLIAALDDTEERTGMSGSRNGKSYSDPRICDMAAWFLSERWPDRYSFDISASLKTRECMRIECLNVWRKAHDLPILPLPQPSTVKVSRNEATKVMTIEWADGGVKPEKSFETRVSKLKGKRLDSEDIVGLLIAFARKPGPGTAGIEIEAVKDEDLTGVRLILRLTAGGSSVTQWNLSRRVLLKGESISSNSGGGSLEGFSDWDDWSDFQDSVEKALAAPPEAPFEISVRITGH